MPASTARLKSLSSIFQASTAPGPGYAHDESFGNISAAATVPASPSSAAAPPPPPPSHPQDDSPLSKPASYSVVRRLTSAPSVTVPETPATTPHADPRPTHSGKTSRLSAAFLQWSRPARPTSIDLNSFPTAPATTRTEKMAAAGVKTRRERTFIGSECAVCDEPLEHTLRGERVLQLSCSHVAHEACFYEFVKEYDAQECPTCNAPLGLDTSRGANIDFERLHNLTKTIHTPATVPNATPDLRSTATSVRQTPDLRSTSDMRSMHSYNSPRTFGGGWDPQYRSTARSQHSQSASQAYSDQDVRRTRNQDHFNQHLRNDSGTTGGHSAPEYDMQPPPGRKHDYDLQSMEMRVASPRPNCKNPIPPPAVTVRSEFPTLTRSRQPQSLTCLVTVEVMDGKWRPDPDDIRGVPAPQTPAMDDFRSPKPSARQRLGDFPRESPETLQRVTEDLHNKVDNWHGLDFSRFGKLILYGSIRVGKDRHSWQDLDCYLFTEMLICVKERKPQASPYLDSASQQTKTRCTLKGSILIRKHLKQVDVSQEDNVLTLSLSVAELPFFHLLFQDPSQLSIWRRALLSINQVAGFDIPEEDFENSGTDEEEYSKPNGRSSSMQSSYGGGGRRSNYTAPTEYTTHSRADVYSPRLSNIMHIPLDIVLVIPVSSSMQGLKISLLRDVLRFLISQLGDSDRMGLVTFGSSGGGMPVVGMTSKSWQGWTKVLDAIKPLGQKSLRADVVEGANVAMDLLMQRKSTNPISSILLISDSAITENESVDFVVSRAEAAKISIHSFGLGLTHKPDTMIELSTRTKATYTYVRDWMMLRECVAGCMGSLQSISHQNVRLKLRLPEGSTAKFVKINGALQIIKRASGRDAEASLGDLRFGDKRDILVQLAIAPDNSSPEQVSSDPWDTIVSGLEALGGPIDGEETRPVSVEEVPLLQADLTWGDLLRQGSTSQLPRPSLLAITMLPGSRKGSTGKTATPPIPPHPSVVQRRMELLTSDMLMRALTLVTRNQADRANHLLTETRLILKGLGKGSLPPLPPPPTTRLPPTPNPSSTDPAIPATPPVPASLDRRTPSPPRTSTSTPAQGGALPFTPAAGIDAQTITALDTELEAALEWISHPAVFGRDTRKAVLQAIGVISSQRACTFRTPAESLWAGRIGGVRRLGEAARGWREEGEGIVEES